MVPEEEPNLMSNILLLFSKLRSIFHHGTDNGTENFRLSGSCPEAG